MKLLEIVQNNALGIKYDMDMSVSPEVKQTPIEALDKRFAEGKQTIADVHLLDERYHLRYS